MEDLETVAGWLRGAGDGGVTVLTGAGVSTGSGIPDYRGPQGVWTRDPEAERLSDIGYYLADRDIRVRAWRRRMESPVWEAEPNAAHRSLVELERRGLLGTLVTQNVDGLHLRAGSSPERVVEIHGSVREVRCVDCDLHGPTRDVFARIEAGEDDPRCRSCGGVLKTTTVYFGEPLDPDDVARAEAAASRCEVFLAAGTSLQVHPVAMLPVVAVRNGARLVIVNAEPTVLDGVADAVILGDVGDVLPEIVGLIGVSGRCGPAS